MSELLLVAENNGIRAVMLATSVGYAYLAPTDELVHQRLQESTILAFAPRSTLRRWFLNDDIRLGGISGSTEDLEVIIQRHPWRKASFYVPFSNGNIAAEDELKYHTATWERFRRLFGPDDWTFKFCRQPRWLPTDDEVQEHLLERAEHGMSHGAHRG